LKQKVVPSQVEKAIGALIKHENSPKSVKRKNSLIEENDFYFLEVQFLDAGLIKEKIRIHLEHPLFNENTEICAIIADKEVETVTEQAKKNHRNLTVMSFSALKKEHKSHEARRKLCGSYDLFLSDKKVAVEVPLFLGKYFEERNKMAIPIFHSSRDIDKAYDNVVKSTYIYPTKGSSCTIKVARKDFTPEQILANVMSVVELLTYQFEGSIQQLAINFNNGITLPFYNDFPAAKLRIEGKKTQDDEMESSDDEVEEQAAPAEESTESTKQQKTPQTRTNGSEKKAPTSAKKATPTKASNTTKIAVDEESDDDKDGDAVDNDDDDIDGALDQIAQEEGLDNDEEQDDEDDEEDEEIEEPVSKKQRSNSTATTPVKKPTTPAKSTTTTPAKKTATPPAKKSAPATPATPPARSKPTVSKSARKPPQKKDTNQRRKSTSK